MIPTSHYFTKFKDLTPIYIDFEYNNSKEMYKNLVAVSLMVGDVKKSIWLNKNDRSKAYLKEYLLSMRETHIFVAFNVVAEAGSFIALKLDPTKFAWIDLQLEYKMLLNHWDKYRYGKQLINGKEVKTRRPKKFESNEAENNSKPEFSLSAALYKMLDIKIDTEHKEAMRQLIISDPKEYSLDQQAAILNYCASDVEYLPQLQHAIFDAFKKSPAKNNIFFSEVAWRGQSAARTALMQQTGYPVAREAVTNFSKSVGAILNEIAEDINRQFPDHGFFEWNKKTGQYVKKEKPLRNWVASLELTKPWSLTDTGSLSLSLESFLEHFNFRHEYPEGNISAQIIRYLKTKQSLNGFMPSAKKKSFFDSYGEDSRSRAWLNPYGSQSSRFQPSATGFIPLKASWMRSLIQPKEGFAVCGIDYSSEEFLLSALLSGDNNMYEAYVSGDPYFHLAKLVKAVPEDAKREDYETVRTRFKSTTLGISYLMGAHGLASKLSHDTGEAVDAIEAQRLIDLFFKAYNKYESFIHKTIDAYHRRGFLKLADGWIMFGDNDNFRSVSNCPIQGMGACILRKAIQLAQDAGLKVIIPLHDALYIEFKDTELYKIDMLYNSMHQAFTHYFSGDKSAFEKSHQIRMDIDVWGPSFNDGKGNTPMGRPFKTQRIYIDSRSKIEFDRFQKYF